LMLLALFVVVAMINQDLIVDDDQMSMLQLQILLVKIVLFNHIISCSGRGLDHGAEKGKKP